MANLRYWVYPRCRTNSPQIVIWWVWVNDYSAIRGSVQMGQSRVSRVISLNTRSRMVKRLRSGSGVKQGPVMPQASSISPMPLRSFGMDGAPRSKLKHSIRLRIRLSMDYQMLRLSLALFARIELIARHLRSFSLLRVTGFELRTLPLQLRLTNERFVSAMHVLIATNTAMKLPRLRNRKFVALGFSAGAHAVKPVTPSVRKGRSSRISNSIV